MDRSENNQLYTVARAADWIPLAAAPAFAIMALFAIIFGEGPSDMLCSAAHDGSPLSGMVPMYLLMSTFHSAPWLKLFVRRRSAARQSSQMALHHGR